MVFFSDIMSLHRNKMQGLNFHPQWDIAQIVWQLISYLLDYIHSTIDKVHRRDVVFQVKKHKSVLFFNSISQ
jgi:hypothetical protein